MAQVSLRNVKKNFGLGVDVIKGVSLDVREGEFLVFVGPSGCGKTTLLRMIAGLEDITSGDLHIGGTRANNVPPAKRGIAMVFQSYALYPHMNAYNNMAFGLKLSGIPRKEIKSRVEKAAEILQINHLLDRKPKELSGGQRQRVAIGRAIVRKPHVFLFDEPLSNLDAALRVQMRVELSRLHKELNATMIYVTHDQVEAMTLGSRIALINNGRIEQIGTPLDLYQNPVNVFVATFLGSPRMNLIKGELVSLKGGKGVVKVAGNHKISVSGFAGSGQAGQEVTLGIRPEHFTPAAAGEGIPAHVELTEHLGDHLVAHVRIAESPGLLAVKFAQDSGSIKRGDTLKLAVPPDQCCLFDEKGQAFERQHG